MQLCITEGQFAAVEGNCERAAAHCDARFTSESHNQLLAPRHCAPAADLIARCAGAEEATVFVVERHGGSSVVMWIFELVKQSFQKITDVGMLLRIRDEVLCLRA